MIQHSQIISALESWAPPALQENYDNSGLLVGDRNATCSGVLVCLDVTEAVIREALDRNCNMIVAHHPLIFSGLKRINGSNLIERCVISAIKNDIALYAIHTNLDNVLHGVNHKIAQRIGLQNVSILSPKRNVSKIITFAPIDRADDVREAMFTAGAGSIGNYSSCSFNTPGTGTFMAQEGTDPYVGEQQKLHKEEEVKIEVVCQNYNIKSVLGALVHAHPYEEVAYDVMSLENVNRLEGAGIVGNLKSRMKPEDFLDHLKSTMELECFRYTDLCREKIFKVAVCGGSGSFLLGAAKKAGADIFITGDFKYHQFFEAENEIIIADIGHYESEKYTIHLILEYLQQKMPNFAVLLTKENTNPIKYKF